MSVTVRPLREDEFAALLERTKDGYAKSMIEEGGNDVARGLYRSLGYTEQAVHMKKDL